MAAKVELLMAYGPELRYGDGAKSGRKAVKLEKGELHANADLVSAQRKGPLPRRQDISLWEPTTSSSLNATPTQFR